MSHVTGHGFQKVMRANRELTYRLHTLPPVPPVLAFMVDRLGMTGLDANSTFNMGAGMVVFVPEGNAEAALAAARECSIEGLCAGVVAERLRQVVLEPVGEVLTANEYQAPSAFRDSPAS